MIDKRMQSADEAVADIPDGATILVSGFGPPGQPTALIESLLRSGVRDLTIVNNNAAAGGEAIRKLFEAERVRKVICSFPRAFDQTVFEDLYLAGKLELELVPQGTLAERIRAAGAGVTAFFTPTGYGTELAAGKETRVIDGKGQVLEFPISGDFALVRAYRADPMGNVVYRKTGRNFGPIMATAAQHTIVEVDEVVELGGIDPEEVVTPSIFVDRIVDLRSEKAGAES